MAADRHCGVSMHRLWPIIASAVIGGLVTHTINSVFWAHRVTAVEVRFESFQESFADFRTEQRLEMRAIRDALNGESGE